MRPLRAKCRPAVPSSCCRTLPPMQQNNPANKDPRPPHREWHGTHHSWGYRPHAFRWEGERLVGINFVPLSRDMHAWMQQRGHLPIASTTDQSVYGGYTNPYTFSGVALTLILARVVNSYHDYANSQTPGHDSVDAEIERLRLYNEIVLYSARFCEVTIKQLLHCTQIPKASYVRKSLGELLEYRCPSCKKENGREPHMVSLVASLAHPFRLCLEFEHCAMDHMALVNMLRNSQAAHSRDSDAEYPNCAGIQERASTGLPSSARRISSHAVASSEARRANA